MPKSIEYPAKEGFYKASTLPLFDPVQAETAVAWWNTDYVQLEDGSRLWQVVTADGGVVMDSDTSDQQVKKETVWALNKGVFQLECWPVFARLNEHLDGLNQLARLLSSQEHGLEAVEAQRKLRSFARLAENNRVSSRLKRLGRCVQEATGLWTLVGKPSKPASDGKIIASVVPVVGMTATLERRHRRAGTILEAKIQTVVKGKDGVLARIPKKRMSSDIYSA